MKQQQRDSEFHINHRIHAQHVRLVGDEMLAGVIDRARAQARADELGLDLVEIDSTKAPPVCKIFDYGKFKYERDKNSRLQRSKQTMQQMKEIHLRPNVAQHDINTKVRAISKFLDDGHNVRITMHMRGRENEHPDFYVNIIEGMLTNITTKHTRRHNVAQTDNLLSVTLTPA